MAADQSDLEQKIGYRFQRRSAAHYRLDPRLYIAERGGIGNDRLEFIGDAVIGLAVAHMLYEHHPERDEGWLTQMRSRLVDKECLAFKARDLNLGDFLILGKGEENRQERENPLSCLEPMRH